MRILYMGNNLVGRTILKWLTDQGEDIVGLVIHPKHTMKHGNEMLTAAGLPPERIFNATSLHNPKVMDAIRGLQPDIGLSIYFGYILKNDFLSLFKNGVINLHPGFLPYTKGANPNIWSIVDRTPAGATLHYIDERIDTGDIIARKMISVEPIDTGQTLHQKLERVSMQLFKDFWPSIKKGDIELGHQKDLGKGSYKGSYHNAKDVESIDHIDLDAKYTARDLINILRARTFPPHKGAYFVENDQKIYMRLQLNY